MVSKGPLNVNSQKVICTNKIEQNFEEEKIKCEELVSSWNNWNAILSVLAHNTAFFNLKNVFKYQSLCTV